MQATNHYSRTGCSRFALKKRRLLISYGKSAVGNRESKIGSRLAIIGMDSGGRIVRQEKTKWAQSWAAILWDAWPVILRIGRSALRNKNDNGDWIIFSILLISNL